MQRVYSANFVPPLLKITPLKKKIIIIIIKVSTLCFKKKKKKKKKCVYDSRLRKRKQTCTIVFFVFQLI